MSNNGISGGFLMYKPHGITSRRADNLIGKMLHTRRVGHVGTLDPIAEGILPVLFGGATRIASYVDSGIKGYRAEITLGITTDTDDTEGKIIESHPVNIRMSEIVDVLNDFLGEIEQIPPQYSAKRVNGVPSYRRARSGEAVLMQPKKVTIHSIENIRMDLPRITFDAVCSTGTYIRALARDVGQRLGCGAHMSALLRTRVGVHFVDNAIPLDLIIESIKAGDVRKFIMTELEMLPHLKKIPVERKEAWMVRHGQIVHGLARDFKVEELFAIVEENILIAVAEKIPGEYKYCRVLA